MVFSYNNLMSAAKSGQRLGKWKDLPVFSCDRMGLAQKGNGAYYVVYDDDNAFVKKSGSMWFRFGYLDKEGSVHEDTKREYFPIRTERDKEVFYYNEKKAAVEYTSPAHHTTTTTSGKKKEEKDGPVGDIKLEIDVEGTLKKAREMTIEDLLAGFNYGL